MIRLDVFFGFIDERITKLTPTHALTVQAFVYMVVGGIITYYIGQICHAVARLF